MKKGISLLSIVMLLLITSQSFAQAIFGAKAGLNLANVNEKSDAGSSTTKMLIGFHIGGTAEFAMSEKIGLEAGLLFSTKGAKQDFSGLSSTLSINYLEIPINCIYKVDLSSLKVLISAGPYLAYALSGKADAETINFGSDAEKDDMKPLDFGLNIGAGVEIKGVSIMMQYGLGLANLALRTDGGYSIKNYVIGISAGYKFGNK